MTGRSRRWAARGATAALLTAGAGVAVAGPAAAHPTDEVVQQVYLTPARSGLTVQLDLTPGVLVAAPFTSTIDTDGDGTVGPAEADAHAAAVRSALEVTVDGRPAELTPVGRTYPAAALLAAGGGTVTLTWTAALPADARAVTVADRYVAAGRPAVQMSVLVPPDPVPANTVPVGRIGHADEGRTMTVALNPALYPAPAADPAASAGATPGSTLLDALRRPLGSPWALAALVATCALLGAFHALTPGHGKALLAAYLVGGRGTPRQAVTLGTVITFTHTAAVLALGTAVLVAGPRLLPGTVVPVLTAVAGFVVLLLGLRLVHRRWRTAGPIAGHGHGHGHGHEPVRTRSLAVMGMSAGMIPCPEALSVLLLAVGLHRTALGLLMIVAFSVGLAAVLVGLGLMLVTAAPAVAARGARVPAWVTTRLPLVSALVVAALGGIMATVGLTGVVG